MTFYEAVKHIDHDNHESDLYLLVTPESAELCKEYDKQGSVFISNVDKRAYFDIPFAYEPWWAARQKAGV